MEQILIPTDFSATARNAVEYARLFFSGTPCQFLLVNTYTPEFVNSRVMALTHHGADEEDHMQLESEEGLRRLLGELKLSGDYPEFRYLTRSSFNLLTEEIRQQLQYNTIDWVVSGTSGASGLKEVFLGSNTVRILQTASDFPVLVVPREARVAPPAKVGFVTDFARPLTGYLLDRIRRVVKRFNSRLEIMHIGFEKDFDSIREFHRQQLFYELSGLNPTMKWVRPEPGKANVIQNYVEDSDIGLLVMVRNDHHPVEEWLREPVVKRLAFHTDIPFLILPPTS